jgi:hypothetical protein
LRARDRVGIHCGNVTVAGGWMSPNWTTSFRTS